MNALQQLISDHCQSTGDAYRDIARRGGLHPATVSWIVRGVYRTAQPKPETLDKLAAGMLIDPRKVHQAGAAAAGYRVDEEAAPDGYEETRVYSELTRGLSAAERRKVEQRAAEVVREIRDDRDRGDGQ